MGFCDVTTKIDQITLKGDTTLCVHLTKRICIYNKWKAYGIPCSHATVACKKLRLDYLRLVQPYYKLSTYFPCYESQFESIPDKKLLA